jgi:hypothetical protein
MSENRYLIQWEAEVEMVRDLAGKKPTSPDEIITHKSFVG